MKIPVSVLMSICRKTDPSEFKQAVISITKNQIFQPSQVTIVVDGPVSKQVEECLISFKHFLDSELTVVRLKQNSGLANALNIGLEHCTNDLIARMDDDDVSLPERLKLEYLCMCAIPDLHVLGGQISGWTQDLSKCIFKKQIPTDCNDLYQWAKTRCPFNHPTVMFRKSTILSVGGYPNIYPEDYLLWVKIIQQQKKIMNLPNEIVHMRMENALKNRRGFSVLPGEIKIFSIFLSIGFITKKEFFANVISRIILRSLPHSIRLFLYRLLN